MKNLFCRNCETIAKNTTEHVPSENFFSFVEILLKNPNFCIHCNSCNRIESCNDCLKSHTRNLERESKINMINLRRFNVIYVKVELNKREIPSTIFKQKNVFLIR